MIQKFGATFPTTKVFSKFARDTLQQKISVVEDPDGALEARMSYEEDLFKAMESSIVKEQLIKVFAEVDQFIKYSLSVQNRRKSRVCHALENHLSAVFDANLIKYSRGCRTENNSKPDFIFPGADEYHNPAIGSPPLKMLGAKTTCKDRWRQVLSEAQKIPNSSVFFSHVWVAAYPAPKAAANLSAKLLGLMLSVAWPTASMAWRVSCTLPITASLAAVMLP